MTQRVLRFFAPGVSGCAATMAFGLVPSRIRRGTVSATTPTASVRSASKGTSRNWPSSCPPPPRKEPHSVSKRSRRLLLWNGEQLRRKKSGLPATRRCGRRSLRRRTWLNDPAIRTPGPSGAFLPRNPASYTASRLRIDEQPQLAGLELFQPFPKQPRHVRQFCTGRGSNALPGAVDGLVPARV